MASRRMCSLEWVEAARWGMQAWREQNSASTRLLLHPFRRRADPRPSLSGIWVFIIFIKAKNACSINFFVKIRVF
jgi:hypothetical protein